MSSINPHAATMVFCGPYIIETYVMVKSYIDAAAVCSLEALSGRFGYGVVLGSTVMYE